MTDNPILILLMINLVLLIPRTIWPFYIAIFVALMLITFVPAISLTLPGLLDP